MVLADGPIKSLADLKGKTVGYSVAGYKTALLGTMLESAGVSLTDVKLVNVNFALTEPLLGGQVDAVVGAYRNVEFYEMHVASRCRSRAGRPGTVRREARRSVSTLPGQRASPVSSSLLPRPFETGSRRPTGGRAEER